MHGDNSETTSFIQGHVNDNSFISTIPAGTAVHALIHNANTPEEMKEGRLGGGGRSNPLAETNNNAAAKPAVITEFGQAANRVLLRKPKNYKRKVRSAL